MADLAPAMDPRAAIDAGYYVEPPPPRVVDQIATRLELEPASTHLLLGGIGSGKTTALLQLVRRLHAKLTEEGDKVAFFDISRSHSLDEASLEGVMTGLAGTAFAAGVRKHLPNLPEEVKKSASEVDKFARGYTEWVEQDDRDDDWEPPDDDDYVPRYQVTHRGVLVAPSKPIPYRLRELIAHLKVLRSAYPGDGTHTIFAFDSLDRLRSPERFQEAVKEDVRVLKEAGIGVVITGPLRFVHDSAASVMELFDYHHFLAPPDPLSLTGREFLLGILRKRTDSSLLPDDVLDPLITASGGVMRDLFALTKAAAEEAYVRGEDAVSAACVAAALDGFGRTLAIGLDDGQVRKLKHLQEKGGFVVRSDVELTLIDTRRVLYYPPARWVVHPALVQILAAIPDPT